MDTFVADRITMEETISPWPPGVMAQARPEREIRRDSRVISI